MRNEDFEDYPFKTINDETTLYHNLMTYQTYTLFEGDFGKLDLLIL